MSVKYDHLSWSRESQTPKRLCMAQEVILYTNNVQKVNKRNSIQNRVLVITNACIYNFKKATFGSGMKRQWAIELNRLEGMATSFEEGHFVLIFKEIEKCDYLFQANAEEVMDVLRTASPGIIVVKTDIDSLEGFRRRKGEQRSFDLAVFRNRQVARVQPEAEQVVLIYTAQEEANVSDLMNYTKVSKGENPLREMVIRLHYYPKYMYFQAVPRTYRLSLEEVIKDNQSRCQFGPLQYVLSTKTHFSLYYDYRLNSDLMRVFSQISDSKRFIGKVAYSLASQLDRMHSNGLLYGPFTPLHVQISPDLMDISLSPPKDDASALSIAVNEVNYANYMAPEVVLRGEYWEISDWWSLGVILWEMMLGKPPFLDAPDLIDAITTANGANIPEKYKEMRSLMGLLVKTEGRTAISSLDILQNPFILQYGQNRAFRP